jgi:predicted DNA-binding ribbon-helix-helix protein
MKHVTRTLTLKQSLYFKLQAIAKKKCLTVMGLIRMILAEYLDRENIDKTGE